MTGKGDNRTSRVFAVVTRSMSHGPRCTGSQRRNRSGRYIHGVHGCGDPVPPTLTAASTVVGAPLIQSVVAATLVALQTRGHGPEHTAVRLALLSRRLETKIDVATTSSATRYSSALRSAAALDQSIVMTMERLAVDRDTVTALLRSAAHAEGPSVVALCRALASLTDEDPAAARYLSALARESP